MIIKMRKQGNWGEKRIDARSRFENALVKKDIIHPEKERFLIFFSGGNASGVINLTHEEADTLLKSLQENKKIIKKIQKI